MPLATTCAILETIDGREAYRMLNELKYKLNQIIINIKLNNVQIIQINAKSIIAIADRNNDFNLAVLHHK